MELPVPLHKFTERPLPPVTVPGSAIPIHALPVIMQNNIELANKPASPPPHPTIAQTLQALPLSLQFSFNQVTLPIGATNVISSYRVYRNTSANTFSGATLMRTFVHDPTRQGAITVQDNTGGGKTYYYFVTSVDTTSLESTPVGAQAGAVTSQNANPNIANAVGTTNNPTTTSGSYVTVPEMTITVTTKGNKVLLTFTGTFQYSSTTTQASVAFFRDGSQISKDIVWVPFGTTGLVIAVTYIDAPTAGSHTYDLRWRGDGLSTMTASGTLRQMQVVELG